MDSVRRRRTRSGQASDNDGVHDEIVNLEVEEDQINSHRSS